MNAISPNLRPICGQNTAEVIPTFGGCFQNADAIDSTTKIKYNVTQMFHYTSSQPTYIDPYPLANLTTEACSPYSTTSWPIFECRNYTNGNLYCYPISTSYIHGSGSHTSSFQVGNYHNYYSQSQDTASNPCGNNRAGFFKNLYGKKTWSGKKSYTSPDYGKPDDWDWCVGGCQKLENRPTNDTTKYLTLVAHASYQVDETVMGNPVFTPLTYYNCDDPPIEIGGNCTTYPDEHVTTLIGTATATSTVNKYGQIVVASCASASSGDFSEGCAGNADCIAWEQSFFAGAAAGLVGYANGTWLDIMAAWKSVVAAPSAGVPDVITHLGSGSWHVEYNAVGTVGTLTHCGPAITPTTVLARELTISPNSIVMKEYGPRIITPSCDDGDIIYSWEKWHEFNMIISDTFFSYDDVAQEDTVSLNWARLITQHADGTLSNPYTAQEVYLDLINNLLPQWDMDKDMPWKSDNRKTVGPIVSRKETTNYPYIGNCNVTTSQWTGEILGKPGPEGINKIWDVSHENYCTCPDVLDPSCIAFYVKDYGAWSTDCGVPRATQWTTYQDSNNFPDGAFVASNFTWTFPNTCHSGDAGIISDDTLYACKYAENIYSKPSFNYARPCGADFLQLSQSTNRCIASVSGDVIALEPTAPNNLIASGSKVWISYGGLDGLWTLAASSAHSVTLHEPRIASASQFPTTPIDNGGTGVIAELRWPNLTDKICGRVGITSIISSSAGSAITASLDSSTYLITGDSVVVLGVTTPALNGTHTIKVIDNDTIILNGTVGGSYYSGQGQIHSPFGIDAKWNDSSPKGDFVYYKWNLGNNIRLWAEYSRIIAQNAANALPYSANCTSGATPCGYYSIVPPVPPVITSSAVTTCISIGPCSSAAVYFSPASNTESFANGINLGWSPTVLVDSVWGGISWSAIVKQSMDDPYYQSPPCRCEADLNCSTMVTGHNCISTWEEDGGFCAPDVEPVTDCETPELNVVGHRYYAARDVFEARSTFPLINDIQAPPLVGSATLLPTSMPQPTAPNTFPQEAGSSTCDPLLVNVIEAPWLLMMAKENCVCNGGRFAQTYAANGIGIGIGPTCAEFGI